MPTIKIKPLPKKSSDATSSISCLLLTQSIDLTIAEPELRNEGPIPGPLDSSGTPQNDKADAVTDLGKSKSLSDKSKGSLLCAEALKKTWCSPIYSFFSNDVAVQYHNGHLCHFFHSTAHKCKTSLGGVRHYQDTKDKSSTTNLKHHAIGCFGENAVNTTLKGKDAGPNSGSIFVAFSRQGQKPVQYSHRTHTNMEVMLVYFLFALYLFTGFPAHILWSGLQKATTLWTLLMTASSVSFWVLGDHS